MEDAYVVKQFYSLYLGDKERKPVTPAIKLKIVNHLCKSIAAASVFPGFLQLSFDAMFAETTTTKLRLAGAAYLHWITRYAKKEILTPIAPAILAALVRFLQADENRTNAQAAQHEWDMIRGSMYVAVGLLLQKVPEQAGKEVELLRSMFQAFTTEPVSVRSSVVEALSSMMTSYRDHLPTTASSELQSMFVSVSQCDEHRARYAAVLYLTQLYPRNDPVAKMACLLASVDEKPEGILSMTTLEG